MTEAFGYSFLGIIVSLVFIVVVTGLALGIAALSYLLIVPILTILKKTK